jgi:putative PEP-CTERM system TPR-repeat lipoprotein
MQSVGRKRSRDAITARFIGVFVVLALLFGMPARAGTYYESALDLYASGDFSAAEIELRNALQESAKNVPARVLLGQVLLERDDPRAAAAELEQGLALGGDRNLILVPLAEVYLQLLQPEKVLTSIVPPGKSPAIDGEILLLQGDAALLLGDLNYAARSYSEAKALLPADPRPLVGEARAANARNRADEAAELLDAALALDAHSAAALTLRGLMLRDAGDHADARSLFDRALQADPSNVKALGARAALFLDIGDEARAADDIERLRSLNPRDLEGIYLQSWLSVSRGDTAAAHALLSETAALLHTVDESRLEILPQVRLLFGIVSFLNHEYEQAVEQFTTFLSRFPRHSGARRYLAAAYLGSGDWDSVVRTLEPEPGAAPLGDPASLALLGEALRARGDYESAARYFSRALDVAPEQVGFVLGLSASRFAAGKVDEAIAALEEITQEMPDFVEARIQLIGMYVDAGRNDAAQAAAAGLLRESPGNARAHNLLGIVMMARGRRDEAAKYFATARELEPDGTVAVLNQARLARLGDRLEAAVAHYREVLAREPNATDASLELAQVLLASGDPTAAAQVIEPLLQRQPNNIGARLVDLWVTVTRGEYSAVEDAMYRISRDFPDNAVAQLGLARVYLLLDENADARLMLRRAAENAGFQPGQQVEIASLQFRLGDLNAAQWALTKALDGNPRHLGALALRVSVLLAQGKTADARTAHAALAATYPDRVETQIAAGELLEAVGDTAGALKAYTRAHQIGANRTTLEKLLAAQIATGDDRTALTTLRVWILRHPGDLGSRHRLGESLLAAGAYRSAQLVYETLIADEPGNPVSLNNLAYALQRLGDDAALAYAERAVAAAPEQADFLDTYGWILVETGEPERGLEVLRDAITRQSTNDEIRYHIALALVRLQRTRAAERELTAAIGSSRPFPSRGDAVALLEQLRGQAAP